jgi:hypothetical protein
MLQDRTGEYTPVFFYKTEKIKIPLVLRVCIETNCQMRRTLVHTPTGFFNCHMRTTLVLSIVLCVQEYTTTNYVLVHPSVNYSRVLQLVRVVPSCARAFACLESRDSFPKLPKA